MSWDSSFPDLAFHFPIYFFLVVRENHLHLLIFYLETLKCDRCWARKTLSSGSVKLSPSRQSRMKSLLSIKLWSFPFVKGWTSSPPILWQWSHRHCAWGSLKFLGLTWGLYFNYSFSFAIVYFIYSFILVSYIQCNDSSVSMCYNVIITSLITICQHTKLLQCYWLYFLYCTLHPFILILLMTHLNISCLGSSPEASVTLTSPALLPYKVKL